MRSPSADMGFFGSSCFSVAFKGAQPLKCHNKFNTGCSPTTRVSSGRGKQRRKGNRTTCVSLHMSWHYQVSRRSWLGLFHWKRLSAGRSTHSWGSCECEAVLYQRVDLIMSTWTSEILVTLCHQILLHTRRAKLSGLYDLFQCSPKVTPCCSRFKELLDSRVTVYSQFFNRKPFFSVDDIKQQVLLWVYTQLPLWYIRDNQLFLPWCVFRATWTWTLLSLCRWPFFFLFFFTCCVFSREVRLLVSLKAERFVALIWGLRMASMKCRTVKLACCLI